MSQSQNNFPTFTCYFCNEIIQNQSEMAHRSTCENVLLQCSNNCGAYVPRKDILKHKKTCRSNKIQQNSASNINDFKSLPIQNASKSSRNLYGLKNKPLEGLKTIEDLQIKFNVLEESCTKQKNDIEKLFNQSSQLQLGSNHCKSEILKLEGYIKALELSKQNTEQYLYKLQERLKLFDFLQTDISFLKDTVLTDQTMHQQSFQNVAQDFRQIRDDFEEERKSNGLILQEQKVEFQQIKDIVNGLKTLVEEQKIKYTTLIIDFKTISHMASEASEKIEIQEREYKQIIKDIAQMKLDIEVFENYNENIPIGRLIWRISEVESKLEYAKKHNSCLKSPLFYSHEFGYKIRIILYLNGLNKWKDRYALLHIHVIKGDYDMLLKWPCKIEAKVVLRDLRDIDKPKSISKYLVAKGNYGNEDAEDPQESSPSYVFIPHSTLLKDTYLKDDTIFFEISIDSKRFNESSF